MSNFDIEEEIYLINNNNKIKDMNNEISQSSDRGTDNFETIEKI